MLVWREQRNLGSFLVSERSTDTHTYVISAASTDMSGHTAGWLTPQLETPAHTVFVTRTLQH